MYFRKRSPLKDLFDKELGKLALSGITQSWIRKYLDDRKLKSHHKTTSKFHIENIIGVLPICATMYLISIIVFVLEVISKKYPQIKYFIDFFTY